jgi:DNA-directed RNA polymerase specialized sigma24 family protein
LSVSIDIADLSDKARRCVLPRYGLWQKADWDDAGQEAALGICIALRLYPGKGPAYYFTAAKTAIYEWLRSRSRIVRSRSRIVAVRLLEWNQYHDHESKSRQISEEVTTELGQKLREAYLKPDPESILQQVRYLCMVSEGYSMDGIALELGLSRRNAYAMREKLLPRLEMLANDLKPERKTYEVRASSLAALQRINSDSGMLELRGKRISEGKKRSKLGRNDERRALA